MNCPHCMLETDADPCPRCGKEIIAPTRELPERIAARDLQDLREELRARKLEFLLPPQEPGEIGRLAGYRVIRLLAKGGMGMVFEAVDVQLDRAVALKVMAPHLSGDPDFRQRFMREARATAAINSDYIVTVHQVGQENDVLFLAMEFLNGEPLDKWMKSHPQPAIAEILRIGAGIARGLAAAHEKGHLHRDIKPSNIFVEEPGHRVKIFDFGITRPTRGGTHMTQIGMVLGTPGFMAPEQADGAEVDERCDLFSLGCVLHELTSGFPAFPGVSTAAILKAVAMKEPKPLELANPEVPPAFAKLVAQLLAKDPAKRPASAHQVAEALDAIRADVEGGSIQRRHPLLAWTRKPGVKKKLLWGSAAALAVALAVAGGFQGMFSRSKAETPSAPAAMVKPFSTAQGITDSEIVLGMSAAFSGPAAELGTNMRTGILTCIDSINDQGGIAGRKLRLVALDDGYEPARALENMKELDEKHKVFAFIGNVGTPTAEVAMPYATEKRMLFFGAYTGASLLRDDPPNRYVFNYRASYVEETEKIVQYLLEVRGFSPQQIAVFAQQDAYGDAGFEGVAKALRKKGWPQDKILRVGYVRNTADVDAAVTTLLKKPEIAAVVMVPTSRPAARFIQKMHDSGRPDLVFANVSFVNSRALAAELLPLGPKYTANVIVTQVVPHPEAGSSIVLETKELLAKYRPSEQLNFVSLEGYVATAVLVAALGRVRGELSTETVVASLESMHDFDLGLGSRLSYGPSDHQASHKVWGTMMDERGRFKILRDMSD